MKKSTLYFIIGLTLAVAGILSASLVFKTLFAPVMALMFLFFSMNAMRKHKEFSVIESGKTPIPNPVLQTKTGMVLIGLCYGLLLLAFLLAAYVKFK